MGAGVERSAPALPPAVDHVRVNVRLPACATCGGAMLLNGYERLCLLCGRGETPALSALHSREHERIERDLGMVGHVLSEKSLRSWGRRQQSARRSA